MLEWLKIFIIRILVFSYSKIFGQKPGPHAMKFMKNLSFIFTGITLSKIFSVLFQIYSGRVLGVEEYGRFALIVSLSNFFWVPMVLGTSVALVKYLSEQKTEEDRRTVISSAMSIIAVLTIVSVLILYIISPWIANLAAVTVNYVFAGIVIAVFYTAWTVSQKIYQGLDKMKKISALNVVLFAFMLVFIIIFFFYQTTAVIPVTAMVTGYIVVSMFVLPELRKYFRLSINTMWIKTILKYGLFLVIGTTSFTINTNINKLFINIFMSTMDVGLYQAYSFSTMNIAAFLVSTFIIVFFPAASKYKKKEEIYRKINKLIKMSPVFYILIFVLSNIILFLYGSEYTMIPILLLLFIFASISDLVFYIHIWFSSSIGISGVKLTTYSVTLVAIFGTIFSYTLIPVFGIYGAIFSTLISFFVGTLFIRLRIRRLL